MGFTTYDKNGNPELSLVQQDDGDWTPSGQPGLNQELKEAHDDEDKQKNKHDGLKGASVLSSAGLADDTPKNDDDDFANDLMLIQDEEDDWQPHGQPGLNAAMQQAKTKAEQEQMKIDGLKGNDVLSSSGLESAGNGDAEDDSTDVGDIFGHDNDNEQLVQEWKPSGQQLEGTPEEAAEKEEQNEAADLVPYKTDSEESDIKKTVEQTDILGAVGLDSVKGQDEEDETEKLGVINTDDIELVQGDGAKKIAKEVTKLKAGKKKTVSKKLAKSAKSVTKKVAGFSKSTTKKSAPHTSKRLLKNVLFLKVYATLVADKVEDNARHLGALGSLLKAMAVESKLNAVKQYVNAMKAMAKSDNHGFPKYTLEHVAKAMVGKGLVVMAPVASRSGVYVRLDGKDMGLQESYPLLGKLAVSVNVFVSAMAKMKKKITIDLRNKAAQHFSLADFKRIFQATCVGTSNSAATFKSCAKKSKATCGSSKSCKWVGAWDGSIAPAVLTDINA